MCNSAQRSSLLLRVCSAAACGAVGSLLILGVASFAEASEPALSTVGPADASVLWDQAYTLATVQVGILTLPSKKICLENPTSCTRGDAAPYIATWMLYRLVPQLALGAGAGLSRPFRAEQYDRTKDFERTHLREYMWISTTARYYALRFPTLEAWLTTSAGVGVVSENYTAHPKSEDTVILGPGGVRMRSEGPTFGIGFGADWNFYRNWLLDTSVSFSWWYLLSQSSCGTTGECPTLSGAVPFFTFGIGIGYRISL